MLINKKEETILDANDLINISEKPEKKKKSK